MMYFKSTLIEQIYELDFIPMGEGWELSIKAEYKAQKLK